VSVVGSRPEIIQAAPLTAALTARVEEILVHTGQHYDDELSGAQILDTCLPAPRHNLGVGSRPDAEQLALGEKRIGEVLDAEKPDGVLVRGDTNATLAGARAAATRGLPLFHVEAGLRSHRDDMPEERNRVETDRRSDVLFAPTPSARANLESEGVGGAVHVTGDVLCDMLAAWRERVPAAASQGEYLLATVHRNYNTDDPVRLQAVLDCLGRSPWPVVLPLHPRTRERIQTWSLAVPDRVRLRAPVPYTEMLALERGARAIATDSGGVVREAYLWGVPCVTLREETEWVETVQTGWNATVGADPDRFTAALARPRPENRPPVLGDGRAAERIAALTAETLLDVQGRAA
jgi:UDP-N-acetylglucosamine 2-epimerase